MMSVSGGEILLNLLRDGGVEYIFCSPGTEWTPVWEELVKRHSQGDDSLKYINCRHETLAVSMAIGYAKSTGRLPAVLLHASVGTLSGSIAIRNAFIGHVPMIILAGETTVHTSDEEVGAQGWHWLGLLSDISGPAGLVKDYVKWSNRIFTRDILIDSVYRGCRIARTSPCGPVFLSMSTDLMVRMSAEPVYPRPHPIAAPAAPSEADLEAAAEKLIDSKSPIIITEHTGKTPEIVARLTELAELLNIPVYESSLCYYASFPRDHRLYMGNNVSEALPGADTIFAIGAITPWYPPATVTDSNTTLIQLNEASWQENLPYSGYHYDLSLITDIETGLTALIKTVRNMIKARNLEAPLHKERPEALLLRHNTMITQRDEEAAKEKDNRPISPKWFLQSIRKILPENAIVLDETLTHSRLVHQYVARPGGYFKSAYGGLGVGIGEAAGVKLTSPDRPVVLIIGDGAFNYNPVLAGLGVSQEYHLPLLIIIMDNGGYGAMKLGYHLRYPHGYAVSNNTFLGVNITPSPDYIKIAEAFGAGGEKIADPADIETILKRSLDQLSEGKTVLLDVLLA